jgi:xanthine dehydrogenase iron-sulfur cluster and FAD-binding subunit A
MERDMNDFILFTLNGKSVRLNTDSDRSLLWMLRMEYGLTGAKYGYGEGHYGSYKRIVKAIRSAANVLKEDR